MKKFLLVYIFSFFVVVDVWGQVVSKVRSLSTGSLPTYTPSASELEPPIAIDRSKRKIYIHNGSTWYDLLGSGAYVDPDPDPNNERITSASVDVVTNMLRIVEGGTIWNIPINSIMAEASISGSGTITVSNVGGVVTVSSTDPDEDATNECNGSFDVSGGNLRIGDACGTLQVAVTDIAPLQGADNGLRVVGDTVRLGGMLIDTTVIYTDKNPFSVLDTSNSSLGCQVKRVFGFDLPSGTGVLNDNIQTSYEVVTGSGDVGYYDELGHKNCDGTIIRRWELSPTLGSDKTFFDFRRAEIKQVYSDPSNSVFNASVVSLAGAQLSSSDVGGATSIQASGSNGNIQSSNILLLQGNDSLLVVAPNRLFVQPINTPSSVVGDVLTMVGANGETEWRAAPSGGLAFARNGLTAVGDTVKLGGALTEFTTIVGGAGNGITIINTDSTTYQSYLNIDETVAELRYDGANSSRVVMKNGTAEFASDSTTIEGRDKLFVLTNNVATSTASTGDVLTLLDPLTGEVDYTDGNGSFWRVNGNSGTDGGTNNFVGTTDGVPLAFRTDNQERMRLQDSGELSIGTTSWLPNTPLNILGNNAQNFNHIRTDNTFAGFSAEHTPSGKYVILGATAGNVGTVIPNTAQFAFTTTAGTLSTSLGATTTVGNYSNTGFLFGGGGAATSTMQLQGSFASNALVIAANYTVTGTDNTLVCNNGATAITVTLPDPTTCLGREYTVLRYAGSTGAITVTDARGATASVQALAGTLGVTTTITALGSHDDWSVKFKAVTVGAVTSWLRID